MAYIVRANARDATLTPQTAKELVEAAKDCSRILEAMRFTRGLGKKQVVRWERLRTALSQAEREMEGGS